MFLTYMHTLGIAIVYTQTQCMRSNNQIQDAIYSGTSEKGLSVLRTQYKKPLYKGQAFLPQTAFPMQYKPLKKENLTIEDNILITCSKNFNVLCLEVPLYVGEIINIRLRSFSLSSCPQPLFNKKRINISRCLN